MAVFCGVAPCSLVEIDRSFKVLTASTAMEIMTETVGIS
jgi:hypothetical protein